MPASRALTADLVPENIRGKLFGRMFALFSVGAILGPIVSTWIYEIHRFSTFKVPFFETVTLRGAGIPYIISAAVGLFSLFVLLAFVEDPRMKRKNKD